MEKRRIPPEELSFSYARSSGPGGQNVNKVNSKAVLKWHVASSRVSEFFKQRFIELFSGQISRSGNVVLHSDRFRSQDLNSQDCIRKLESMAARAAKPQKKRKPTKVPRAVKEKRLDSKRKRAQKKQGRKPDSTGW